MKSVLLSVLFVLALTGHVWCAITITPTGTEVLTNGNFESTPYNTGWTSGGSPSISAYTSSPYEGTTSLQFTATGYNSNISQTITPVANTWYSGEMYGKRSTNSSGVGMSISSGPTPLSGPWPITTESYSRYTVSFLSYNTTPFAFRPVIEQGSAPYSTVVIDAVSLKRLDAASVFYPINSAPASSDLTLSIRLNSCSPYTFSGIALCVDSWVNPQNYIVVYTDCDYIYGIEFVGGAAASKMTATRIGYEDNTILTVVKSGTTVTAKYKGKTIVSGTFTANTNTNHGIFSTSSANSFDTITPATHSTPATYKIDPSAGDDTGDGINTAWKTLARVQVESFIPGDILDGQSNTVYDRIDFTSSGNAGNYITIKNIYFDSTIDFNGTNTINPSNIYKNLRLGSSWALVSGAIYKKYSTRCPYKMFEDGVELTPIVCSNETDVINNLQPGGFSYVTGTSYLYYRATDGGNPSTHNLRVARRDYDSSNGMLNLTGTNYLNLQNIRCSNANWNGGSSSGIYVSGSSYINFASSYLSNNGAGIVFNEVTYMTIVSSCQFIGNISDGLFVQGNSSDLDISGVYNNNGRVRSYNGASYSYTTDGDNIGIGGTGGTMSNITIHDATVTNSGAPDGTPATAFGSGIYVGTANPMSVSNLTVTRCFFSGNHLHGCAIGGQVSSYTVASNIFVNHVYPDYNYRALHTSTAHASFTAANINNNVFANNTYGAFYIINSASGGTIKICNNIFLNNGNATSYSGDMWISNTVGSNLTESNNLFHRSAGAWGTTKVIRHSVTFYDINHIIGGGAGYWQYDSGKGANDIITDPKFLNLSGLYNTNTDFKLKPGSPCINTGLLSALPATDFNGKVWISPDIGAYAFRNTDFFGF
jgi:hypothetical protein